MLSGIARTQSGGVRVPRTAEKLMQVENDVAVGSSRNMMTPRAPGWIHLKKMLTPGLPETPPPPPPQQPPPVSTNNYNAMNPYAGGWMPQIYLRHSGMGNEYVLLFQLSTAQLAWTGFPFTQIRSLTQWRTVIFTHFWNCKKRGPE